MRRTNFFFAVPAEPGAFAFPFFFPGCGVSAHYMRITSSGVEQASSMVLHWVKNTLNDRGD